MSHLFDLPVSREPPGANLTAAPDPSISSKPDPPKHAQHRRHTLRPSSFTPDPSSSGKQHAHQLRRYASRSSLVHGPISVESSISQNSDIDNDTDSGRGASSREPTRTSGRKTQDPDGKSIPGIANATLTPTLSSSKRYSSSAKAPVPNPTPRITREAAAKGGETSIKSVPSKASKSKSFNNYQSTASSAPNRTKSASSTRRMPPQKSPTSVIDVIQEGLAEDDSVPFDERSTPWWQREETSTLETRPSIPWWQRDVVSNTHGSNSFSSVPKVIIKRNDIQEETEAQEDTFEDEYNLGLNNNSNNSHHNSQKQQQRFQSDTYNINNNASFRSSDYESIASSVFKLISNAKKDPPAAEVNQYDHMAVASPQKFVRKNDKMLRRKVMDPEPCSTSRSSYDWVLPSWKRKASSASNSTKEQRNHHHYHQPQAKPDYYTTASANVDPALAEAYNYVVAAATGASDATAHQKPTPDCVISPTLPSDVKNRTAVTSSAANHSTNGDRWVPPPSLQDQIYHAQVYQSRLEEVLKDPIVQHRLVIPTPEQIYHEMIQEQEIIRKVQETDSPNVPTTKMLTSTRARPQQEVSISDSNESSPPLSASSEDTEEVEQNSASFSEQIGLNQSSSSSESSSPSDSSVESNASESFHDEEDGQLVKSKPVEHELVEKLENPGYSNCWEALWGNLCGIGLLCGCLAVWVVVLLLALTNWGDDLKNSSSPASTTAPTLAPPAPVPTTGPPVTLSPAQQNANKLFEELPIFSQEAIRANPGTPQGRAWQWLQRDDELELSGQRLLQRFALATLFYATDGNQWDFIGDNRWLSHDLDECMWYRAGLVCSSDNLVEVLYLPKHNLNGEIPAEIGILTHLEELSLGTNPQLRGTIPTVVGSLTALQGLDLEQSNLSGILPSEIGYLTELMWLTVASKRSESDSLSVTRQADDTRSGKLSSTIPSQIGELTKLMNLRMENQRFQGRLPTEMQNLIELRTLVLSNNQLTGPLPESWSKMSKLEVLQLDSNAGIMGTIPDRWGAEWAEIQRLWLHNTSLVGSVTATLCFLNTDSDYALDSLRVDCSEITCGCGCWCE